MTASRAFTPDEAADGAAAWRMSPVLEANGFLFFSGVTGVEPNGAVSPDAATQAAEAFRQLGVALDCAGAGYRDLVEITTYHTDIRADLAGFRAVKDRHVVAPYPAWTAIGVSALATPGAVVEIRAIARRGDGDAGA